MPARKKNTAPAAAPRSGPHAPQDPPTAPSAAPPADGPAAAVWAALTVGPGATAARVAAASLTRIAAGRELAALEASGLATRTPGARQGRATVPATWQPVLPPPPPGTSPDPADPAGDLHAASAPGDSGDGMPDAGTASQPGTGNPAPAGRHAPGQDGGTPDSGPDSGPAAGTQAAAAEGSDPQPAAAGQATALLGEAASAA